MGNGRDPGGQRPVENFFGRELLKRGIEHGGGKGIARAGGVDHVRHGAQLPAEFSAYGGGTYTFEYVDADGKARTGEWDIGIYNID